ncbi:hypothetical protein QOZ80_5AG0406460 [Eleusine coracana subsp. coracana]|nr:hypothetical protein QOZ80_5AG0406460 [Eleusine coracana subsp. coracana]
MASLDMLADDLVREFLILLTPDDPTCLLRASLVCKRWRRILADPDFYRRHRALHGASPILGFIHVVSDYLPYHSRFVPIGPAPGGPAARDLPGWLVLDCRHGRALFVTLATGPDRKVEETLDFIVWNPLTNKHIRLPRPDMPPLHFRQNFNAAVLCAADTEGGDHLDCHRGHFHVVFVRSQPPDMSGRYLISACVYSSVTNRWNEWWRFRDSAIFSYFPVDVRPCPSALVGNDVYFRGCRSHVFQYKLSTQHLSVEQPPPDMFYESLLYMSLQDGGLGYATVEQEPNLCISLWSREILPNGDAQWARGRAIGLDMLLPNVAIEPPYNTTVVVGFAEGTDVIFVAVRSHGTHDIYMVQFNSESATKVLDNSRCSVFPYKTFCVPVIAETAAGNEPAAGKEPGESSSARQTHQVAGN